MAEAMLMVPIAAPDPLQVSAEAAPEVVAANPHLHPALMQAVAEGLTAAAGPTPA